MEPQLWQKPTALDALSAIVESGADLDVQADRINVQIQESGEVAFRVHPSDGSDYVGGVVRAETIPFDEA